ncbi:DNA polymerase [Flavobacterium sp. CAU 1735]|uniref:DNA polymerase n=1 Tax=Flavobacterium sp. CAU 1735 TaxID=3140361 RepID=UPI0032611118
MNKYITMLIGSQWHSLNVHDFNDYKNELIYNFQNTYITFQTSDLIREFKSKESKRLPGIIDLESFDKQMSQEGKEFREFKNWRVLNFLRHNRVIDSKFELKESNFKMLLELLATLYLRLLEKDNTEKERFEKIETHVNKIIYERQLKGIRIDSNLAKQKCSELEKEIYKIKNDLQLEHNIFSPDDEKFQLIYLKSKGYNIIKSSLYTFKVHRNEDKVSKLLYELIRKQQDLDSFIYILSHWGGKERTYPDYYGFGTITSRVILRQPSLQNFRKSNRTIIIPDKGMKLLYVDYSQFEAGILASLSDDKDLIELYNTDIYSNLAENVLENKTLRSDAKIIFYRYMYGDNTLSENSKRFFKKFKKLEQYKQKIDVEISTKKKIGSVFGNYRYSFNDEHVWSLSHVIQSTASLIYKNALIRVRKEIRNVDFLIPMHDATLYQVDELQFDQLKARIEDIYKDEFKKICSKINVRINSGEFAEETN